MSFKQPSAEEFAAKLNVLDEDVFVKRYKKFIYQVQQYELQDKINNLLNSLQTNLDTKKEYSVDITNNVSESNNSIVKDIHNSSIDSFLSKSFATRSKLNSKYININLNRINADNRISNQVNTKCFNVKGAA